MAKRAFKQKRVLSGKPTKFRKWADWDEGDLIVGKFLEKGFDSKYEKDTFMFEEVEATFKDKKAEKEINEAGVITLNASGKLNKAMEKCEPGDVVQVTFNGVSQIASGKYAGKDANDIEVMLMEEDYGDEEGEEDDARDEL